MRLIAAQGYELVNREDGAMIDQLLLTIRPPDLYVPVGLEEAGG